MKLFLLFLLSFQLILCKKKNVNSNNKSGRRLQDTDVYCRLNIFLDFTNFELKFPNDKIGEDGKRTLLASINNMKTYAERMFSILTDIGESFEDIEDQNREEWGLDVWEEEIFKSIEFGEDSYNYYIAFRFSSDINNAVYSTIVEQYALMPLIGIITFHPDKISPLLNNLDYLNTLMFHQIIHLLGFHIDVWYNSVTPTFQGKINQREEAGEIHYFLGINNENPYYDTPNVINYAIKYFDCDSITKIELELDEDNNIHWPSRILLGELMTSFNYPEEQVLSGFTIAFLQDLGYLEINQNYIGGLMKFGKNKGCEFLDNSCGANLNENKITFANEFYLPTEISSIPETFEPSCSSGRLSKTVHKIYSFTPEPTEAEYNINGFTGPEKTKYCPISEFNRINSNDNIYLGLCSYEISVNGELQNILDESFTNHSFCVLSSLINKEKENYNIYSEYRAVCHEMFCSSESLTIKIKDRYLVCPREGGRIKAKDFVGYLLCPDFNLICTGTTLCNNLFNCFDESSEEKEESFNYDYTIETTQNSEEYNSISEDKKNYYEKSNNGKCPILCKQCLGDKTCIECALHYKLNENKKTCIEIVPNCKTFSNDEEDICIECKTGYFLAKEDKNNQNFECLENIPTNQYYSTYDEDLNINYYEKCHNGVNFCSQCESKTKCTKCIDNSYVLVDDGSICGILSTHLYFWNENIRQYQTCSKHMTNCKYCKINDENNFECIKCDDGFALSHGNDVECDLKTNLESRVDYFTNDTGINYYSCSNSLYHDVSNCLKCSRKETCTECQSGLNLVNNGQRCILQSDVDNKIIYFNPTTQLYTPCSELISLCHKCNNESTCTDCGTDGSLDINDKCASNDQIQNNNYYLDETTNKYVSCSIINNCLTCSSNTICISCNPGYILNNDKKCDKINEDDDDGLSTGAIIGIVFGSLGFLLIVAGVIYYLINKMKKQNNYQGDINVFPEDKIEPKNEQENDEINEPEKNQVKTTKRSIHNV